MSFFDELVQRLFPANQRLPFLEEPLERSAEELQRAIEWAEQPENKRDRAEIYHAYQLKLQQEPSHFWQVHLLKATGSNGFALTCQPDRSVEWYRYLFDYWKHQLLTLGYQLATADRRIFDKGQYVQTIERYYLKPKWQTEPPLPQLYGNILIEYVLLNEQPSFLKLMANFYQDRYYQPVQPFADLLTELLLES